MRSYLYVPGDQPEKLAKAASSAADALIVDLEDAVAPKDKDAARSTVVGWLRDQGHPQVWIRVNADPTDDASALSGLPFAGVVIPKIRSASDVDASAALFPSMPICALIETAAAVLDARAIASHPRVVRLAIGEADLSAELGADATDDDAMRTARGLVVLASAAAGIEQPTAPVSTDFRDMDSLHRSTEALKRMGFGSRAAIHPAQLPVINDVFTPSGDEVARARTLLERFDGAGVGVADDGTMVDEAVLRAARAVLDKARD